MSIRRSAKAAPLPRSVETSQGSLPRIIRVRSLPGAPHRGLLRLGNLTLPCALGRSGVTAFKREGDGATPRGRLPLLFGWWRADRSMPPARPIPLGPLPADLGWSDDPVDGRYNRPLRLPLRGSHEVMRRDDGLYDVVIVLDWNIRSRGVRRGSAIFFHLATPDLGPTAGCVALRPADMRRLLARLGRDPVLIVEG